MPVRGPEILKANMWLELTLDHLTPMFNWGNELLVILDQGAFEMGPRT